MAVEIIKTVTKGLVVCGSRDGEITGVSTDSRTTKVGDLFVALAGEHFDGHDYIRKALAAGAAAAVYSRDFRIYKKDAEKVFIKVDDTLTALGEIAKACRHTLRATIVAITGSNGKTTTKEMVRHFIEEKIDTVASPASYNNLVGVPLTLFRTSASTRAVVLEMGTSRPGEIARLAEIAAPDVGVVTNIGRTHIEGLGSVDGVAHEKSQLLHGLSSGGTAILNADDPILAGIRSWAGIKLFTFGIDEPADVFASQIERGPEGYTFFLNGAVQATLGVSGRHNIYNALAATAVARRLGLDLAYIAGRMASFRLPAMRLEERLLGGAVLINDAYNANPDSMVAATRELAARKGERKFFVFADMLELGEQSAQLHRRLGRETAQAGFDFCWATGEMAHHATDAAAQAGMGPDRARFFPTLEDLGEALSDAIRPGDVVLLKASRGMRLERVLDFLK